MNFDLTVKNALADDGLNVKNAITNISNSTFEGNSSDAFDGDWSQQLSRILFLLTTKATEPIFLVR